MSQKNEKKIATSITITNTKLVFEFYPAIDYLGQLQVKNIDVLMRIAKAKKHAKELSNQFNELKTTIFENSCDKDETKKPIIENNEQGNPEYKYSDDNTKKEALEMVTQLQKKEVTFDITPIRASDLKDVKGMTANTLEALGDFIRME